MDRTSQAPKAKSGAVGTASRTGASAPAPAPGAAAPITPAARAALMTEMTGEIPRLRRFARVLARDPDRADDLVQEALTRAISRIETFQPGTSMRAWLFTILHNTHISAARRNARSPISEATDLDLVPAPVAPRQESGLAMRDLASAFGALPENQQQVMMLVAVEGMDYADAARVLEVPVGTVRSRLSRARDALRAALGEDPRTRPAEAP